MIFHFLLLCATAVGFRVDEAHGRPCNQYVSLETAQTISEVGILNVTVRLESLDPEPPLEGAAWSVPHISCYIRTIDNGSFLWGALLRWGRVRHRSGW